MFFWPAFFLVCTVMAVLEFLAAPEGYQDENGFHLGKEPAKQRVKK